MKLCGIDVDFPYPQPYRAQVALMAKAMGSFVKQENAILESPTGTGKSLALLSSSLAYQLDMKNKHPESMKFNFDDADGNSDDDTQKPIKIPKIWYTSRTHTQLTQLVGELRKLKYTPKMSILASRKQTCIFPKAQQNGEIEENCQRFRKEHSCPYGQRTSNNFIPKEISASPPLKFDIEELNGICREDMRCPYLVSKNMVKSADLIFAPYNYIIDPLIREQMNIDLKGSILIIDEAHNIEQTCRDAASLTLKYNDIVPRQNLWNLNDGEKELYKELVRPYANIKYLLDSICDYFNNKRMDIDTKSISHKGTYLVEDNTKQALEDNFHLSLSTWNSFNQDYKFILKKEQQDDNPNIQDRVPSPAFTRILRMIFGPLQFLFLNDGANFEHFKIVYQYDIDREGIKDQLRIICLNPGVVFNPISQRVHNVILTSGTLTPLTTFASELGTSFPNLLSALHVIDPKQVVTVTISKSMTGESLSSTFNCLKNNSERIYLNIAEILKKILPVIPDGVLFFLPSYSLKASMISAWKKGKCFEELDKIKRIFIEEQGSADKKTLKQYKDHIRRCRARGNKSPENGGNGEGGGLYIAVCRGKLSEGMDFHDSQARSVIIFGIPYPNIYEPEIKLKREYNDNRRNNENIGMQQGQNGNNYMSGQEWYETQAFRALFQAVGRCIRHKNDYGSVILIDERFENDIKRFPKWVLRSWDGQSTTNFDDLKLKLSSFYGDMINNFPIENDDENVSDSEEISDTLPFNLTCADCTKTIFSQVMLKMDSTILIDSKKKGFLEIIKEEKPQLVYIMKEKEKKESQAGKGEVIWYKDELIAYEPILCSVCGKILGAKIISASGNDISLIDSYLLHVEKFYANQKGRSQPFGKIVKKPKVMTLNMENTGDSKQSRLSFT